MPGAPLAPRTGRHGGDGRGKALSSGVLAAAGARAVRLVLAGMLALTMAGCGVAVPAATAAQRARVDVTLYTTRWCPVCARARRWLRARHIPFDEYDVEADPRAAARFRRLSPGRTVPVIDVEGRVLVGFDAEDLRRLIDRAAAAHTADSDGTEAPPSGASRRAGPGGA